MNRFILVFLFSCISFLACNNAPKRNVDLQRNYLASEAKAFESQPIVNNAEHIYNETKIIDRIYLYQQAIEVYNPALYHSAQVQGIFDTNRQLVLLYAQHIRVYDKDRDSLINYFAHSVMRECLKGGLNYLEQLDGIITEGLKPDSERLKLLSMMNKNIQTFPSQIKDAYANIDLMQRKSPQFNSFKKGSALYQLFYPKMIAEYKQSANANPQ